MDGTQIPVEIENFPDLSVEEVDKQLEVINYVRVVRCRDCKYSYFADREDRTVLDGPFSVCTLHSINVEESDYCSRGKER